MSPSPEQAELQAFLRFFSARFGGARPLAALDEPASLRMAVNDCLEFSGHWPLGQVTALDAELRSKGLLTLSQVRQRAWGRYAAIVKHGQIRTEADYHAVRGVLADPALASTLPEAERQILQAVSAAYEQKPSAAPPKKGGTGKPARRSHGRR
jgi:hypothetical protein